LYYLNAPPDVGLVAVVKPLALALPLSNNSLQAGNTPQHAGRNSLFKYFRSGIR
jgi:hypothetical protein